jgi:uracil-DNA glycosylase
LLKQLGLQTRDVYASNLLFVRSIGKGQLINERQLIDRCWPIHKWIIEIVQPRVILAIGGRKVLDYICTKARFEPVKTFPLWARGLGPCYATQVQLGGTSCRLISVPHLSRYNNIEAHPEVAAWIRQALS